MTDKYEQDRIDRLHKSVYGQTLDEMKEDKGAWELEQGRITRQSIIKGHIEDMTDNFTLDEISDVLKQMRECTASGKELKIGDEVYIHGYIDEIRGDEYVIIHNEGGYFGTVRSEIKPLKTDGMDTATIYDRYAKLY